MEILLFFILIGLASFFFWKQQKSNRTIEHYAERHQRLQEEKDIIFDFLHDLGEAFVGEVDSKQLFEIIIKGTIKVTSATSGVIYIKAENRDMLEAQAISGMFPPPFYLPIEAQSKISTRVEYLETVLRNEELSLGDKNIISHVARTGRPEFIRHVELDDRFPEFEEQALKMRSFIAVPLKYRSEILGVMALSNRVYSEPFHEGEFEIAKSIADQASFSLHNAMIYTQLAEKKVLDSDLATASEIQRILLPNECPTVEGYGVSAINLPAKYVSGDYYDFLDVDEDHVGIVVADVSGKGVPASLIMAMCRAVMRTQAPNNTSAAQVLRQANRILFPDIREDMFITMIYMILNTKENKLTIAKAGHDAPLLCTPSESKIEALKLPGMALGIDSGEVFDTVIEDLVISLKPQDTLFVYTDGINEAIDEAGQEFGIEQVKEAVVSGAVGGVDFLTENIVERVVRFRGEEIQSDDITVVALQRK